MESLSKQELISTITKQADQIKRYEARLRDVVAAYKGLVKEKEALEISLKALNKTESPVEGGSGDDSVATLTLSLSTLTAEKARMEEAFQADKKVTRYKYENIIATMREETKTLVQQHLVEVNNLKAKISYEIQEREKERADHAAMMKELHLKLNSERKTKEKLEDRVVNSSEAQVRDKYVGLLQKELITALASQAELEKRVRDLSSSLEAAQRRLQRAEARTVETPAMLVRLQQKLALLEQSHSVAIREEQIKAMRAEESARKACARGEERACALEARVCELSRTVGDYVARRHADLDTIKALRNQLRDRLLTDITTTEEKLTEELTVKSETDTEKLADSEYLQNLMDKIHILKKELISENDKLGCPIDITTVFKVDGYENIHTKCKEEYDSLKAEFEAFKANDLKNDREGDSAGEIERLKSEVTLLRDKLETYGTLLEEERQDKLDSLKIYEEKLRLEQEYHKEVTSELKTRVQSLEKQVQTQRDRYAALLDETDNYIRGKNERARRVSAEEGWRDHGVLADVSGPPHMLHYAHELARKDLDISHLRKEKHILEGQHRDCQREATIEKERFKEVIRALKEEIDRLRRIQSREGANLEYLKNVVMAYLLSTDYAGRKHMLNAIAAVLHFTTSEKNMVLSTL